MDTDNINTIQTADSLDDEVLSSLTGPDKSLPCKLFYDKYGSYLFDLISELDEYYITRTELSILQNNISEIAGYIGENCVLIELGSGNSKKIRIILDNISTPKAYIPVDISKEYLKGSEELVRDYPGLRIIPVLADYTRPFSLPEAGSAYSRVVAYYPGSTIGNFHPDKAGNFLNRIAETCKPGSGLLIGFDLKKDREVLERAYNDSSGITAEFNLNILRNLNNTLGTDFDLDKWSHIAFYNEKLGRIEMHLKSLEDQRVSLNGRVIEFRKNETIHTESSYKYSLEEFISLAEDFYTINKYWTDPLNKFCLAFLTANTFT